MQRGSLICSLASLQRPKAVETLCLNTDYNLFTVNNHLKAIVRLWFATHLLGSQCLHDLFDAK